MSEENEDPTVVRSVSFSPYGVYTVSFSPDQSKLCYGGEGINAVVISLQNDKTERELRGHKSYILGSDFSSDGRMISTASEETTRIWNVVNENKRSIKLDGHASCVHQAQFSQNDPTRLISCSDDKSIKIWDLDQKKEVSSIENRRCVYCVDILPNNQTIISGDSHEVRIWDSRSGKCIKKIEHEMTVYSVEYHHKTNSFASGCFNNATYVFDFRTFKVLQKFQEHTNWVNSVSFHHSGRYLLSGSSDCTVKVYDLFEKETLYTLKKHDRIVECVKFSPDGKLFASASYDLKLKIWNFPRGRFMTNDPDLDVPERVKYLVDQDLLEERKGDSGSEVLKVVMGGCTLVSYKFFFCY